LELRPEEFFRNLIEREGPVPFSRFVEEALYNPQFGYYSTGRAFKGEGDFFTAPMAGELFGLTLAQLVRELGARAVLEIGAGKGHLALDILSAVKVDYYILEKSRALRAEAQWALGDAVRFVDDFRGFKGLVILNEVLDAFGFDRFLKKRGEWRMLYVGWPLKFVEGPPRPDAAQFLPEPWPEKVIYDLSVEAVRFLEELLSQVDGYVLVLDYGFNRRQLAQRPEGTLTCYRRHTVNADPFRDIGRQDITYFLDWDLIRARASKFAREELFLRQSDLLVKLGIHRVAEVHPDPQKARLQAKTLLLGFRNHWALLVRTV